MLYPIYVGFQTARLAGKQLQQTAQQIFPQLQGQSESQPLASDAPIQRSLQFLQQLNLALPANRIAVALDPQHPTAPGVMVVVGGSALARNESWAEGKFWAEGDRPEVIALEIAGVALPGRVQARRQSGQLQPAHAIQVQGIASLLISQQLVLVTVENQILDVFSLEQQGILQRKIVGESASYWHQQRRLGLAGAGWVNSFLPLPKERTHALPPIRAFWAVMSWMQRGSVASATNLFQESQLLQPAQEPPRLPGMRSAQPTWKSQEELIKGVNLWFRDQINRLPYLAAHPTHQAQANHAPSQLVWLTEDQLFHPIAQSLGSFKRSPALARVAPSNVQISSAQISSAQISSNETSSVGTLTLQSATQTQGLVEQPSWIEAEVQLVRYEQHPLELILGWLDRGMSWIEHRADRVWQWLRDRWFT